MAELPLEGTHALVTGASRGIGEGIAYALARAGTNLTLAARSYDDLERVAATCREKGVQVNVAPTDLAKTEDIERLAASVDTLDILVNNAGLWHAAPVHQLTLETWDELFNVNVRAMFYLTHLLVPKMIAAGHGDIVNIGSTAGLRGFAGGTAYSASKFAVHGFTAALRKDLRPYGIRVMGIVPADVDNDLMGENPPPDTYLTPRDIGSAVVYAVTLPPHASIHNMLMVGMAEDW